MTLEEFIDMCELSLVILVADYGANYSYRAPTASDLKRRIMRIIYANRGAVYIVLKYPE